MKPYTKISNSGRKKSIDDINHATRDVPRSEAKATAKAQRKAARREGKSQSLDDLELEIWMTTDSYCASTVNAIKSK